MNYYYPPVKQGKSLAKFSRNVYLLAKKSSEYPVMVEMPKGPKPHEFHADCPEVEFMSVPVSHDKSVWAFTDQSGLDAFKEYVSNAPQD